MSIFFSQIDNFIFIYFRLENADFIWRYSWWYARYYDEPPDDTQWFWIDPVNSLLEFEESKLTRVGEAYNRPWHLEKSKQ